MPDATIIAFPQDGRPSGISPQEWQARCELAAAYRLCALYGWTDLNNTHLSLRVPGTTDHFLLNPFGMFFEEITASSLIKVDGNGNLLGESDYPMNPAGFVIHGAIHMSGDDRHCVVHTHSRYGTAVSMQAQGLLPAGHKALTLAPWNARAGWLHRGGQGMAGAAAPARTSGRHRVPDLSLGATKA